MTIKSRHADQLRAIASEAAGVLSVQLGVPITRHAAMLIALRRGLADILARELVLDDER
jgi:hypothetical protein